MTDFETELQRLGKELRGLVEDLGSPEITGSTDWGELVPAKHSLGRDIRVTRLDLAAEFLGVFAEQEQLLERIRLQRRTDRYYLERDEDIEDRARQILRDEALVKDLAMRIREEAMNRLERPVPEGEAIPPDEARDDGDTLADQVLHETVEAERGRLLADLVSRPGAVFPELVQDLIEASRDSLEPVVEGLSPHDFKALGRWLKSYRRATLHYTWLSPEDSESLIHQLTTFMRNHESYPFGWLLQLSNHPEYAELDDEVCGIWEQLAGLFGQIDFDDIIEDLKDGFPPFGPDGGDTINVIPGDGKVACKPVLLAFAKGSGTRGKFAFENVMKAVKKHLIDCQDVVKLVVFVTDTWDSRKFMEDHYGELSSWRRKDGVRFLFLGVGAPRDQIAPLAVDLT